MILLYDLWGMEGQRGDYSMCQSHLSCSHQLMTPAVGGLAVVGGSQAVTLFPSPLFPQQPCTLSVCLLTSASKQSQNRVEQR